MSRVAEIQTAIEQLSPQEKEQLREWLLERGQPQGSTVPVAYSGGRTEQELFQAKI